MTGSRAVPSPQPAAFRDAPEDAPTLLDARGLACPLPVLKARKAMRGVAPGGLLEVLTTDPGAAADFRAFCEVTGHRLEATGEKDGAQCFLIRARER